MDISIKKIGIALVTGIVVLASIDYFFGKVTNSLYALPLSVFIGAGVAGAIVVKRAWLIGIVLGLINAALTYAIYKILGPTDLNLLTTLIYPVVGYLLAGAVGGFVGGIIGGRLYAH